MSNLTLIRFTDEYQKELGNPKKALDMLDHIWTSIVRCKVTEITDTVQLDDTILTTRNERFSPFPDYLKQNPTLNKVAKRHGFKTNREFCLWFYEQKRSD